MNDYEFIKEYNKNMKTIGQICREHKIDQSNLMRGKTNSHKQKIVADELKKTSNKILFKYYYKGSDKR